MRRIATAVLIGFFGHAQGGPVGTLLWEGADPAEHSGVAQGSYRLFPGAPLGGKAPEDAVIMGIVDSGVASRHPQLAGYLLEQRDFTGEGSEDVLGHGTAVALVAVFGTGHASPPVALVSAKVADREGKIRERHVIEAIDWVVARGARVVNLSLGFEGTRTEHAGLCKAIERHESVMFAAAAGNSGADVEVYPAKCPARNLLSVAAADASGNRAGYSGRGDVMAPGSVRLVAEWRYHYEAGQRLARAGRPAQARELYERSLRTEPNAESEFQLGVLDLHEGSLSSAIGRFRAALQIDPGMAEAHEMLGAALLMRKDYRRAERSLRESLVHYPDVPQTRAARARAYFNLGQLLVEEGRLDEAEQALLTVKRLAPGYPRVEQVMQEVRAKRQARQNSPAGAAANPRP